VRDNIFLAIIIFVCLAGLDQYYQISKPISWKPEMIESGLILGMCFSLSGLAKNRHILIITGIMIASLFLELVYSAYFGAPIAPMDIALLFTNSMETLQIFSDIKNIAYIPLLISMIAFGVIFFSIKTLKKRRPWRWAGVLLVLLMAVPLPAILITLYHHGVRPNPNVSVGDYPSVSDHLLFSAQKTGLYFLVKTLPSQLFLNNPLAQPLAPPLPIALVHPNVNIIFIMGESLTSTHMSSYGYSRPTTPYLDSLKKSARAIFKLGISGGVSTDISLPLFFNMIEMPDGTAQIASAHRNLFKMAKANGFETYFISTQADYYLNVIKGYLFPRYIDHFGNASFFGAGKRTNVDDIHLVNYLKSADLTQPTFMVLHQRGSHSPYHERYPPQFNFFVSAGTASFQQSQMDSYDNSVRYTDALVHDIVATIHQKTHRPTVLIFTSDHGESLGENGVYGHNRLQIKNQHQAPIILIGLNNATLNFLKRKNREDINPQYMSHYELAEIVAYLLGYQIAHFSTQKSGYFVDGNALSGAAGFEQLRFDESGHLIDQ